MNQESDKKPSDAIKSSEDFDKEMEEFFTMRAMERSQTIHFDGENSSSLSDSGGNTYKIEKKWDAKESAMTSGCCMTGCHNCPWGYKLPSEDQ
ncbi:MAG: hypothetical protein HRT47_11885 [Candidatus Caenarcaniphilales bacterium]|nr:hypothetical protein [Candidatus Caenarcaniphilales bacterium]